MRTFHSGGVAGSDITQGLPRVEELFEARAPKKAAIMAEQNGVAYIQANLEVPGMNDITVHDENGVELAKYPIPYGPLESTGRAYYGNHIEGDVKATDFGEWTASGAVKTTLEKPLPKHLADLNKIRRAVPALQKGQYSNDGCNGNMSFKRRFTKDGVDSFVLVTISGGATFSGIPGGTYVDVVTGDKKTVSEGGTLSASCSGSGNARIYVLQNQTAKDYGADKKIAGKSQFLK